MLEPSPRLVSLDCLRAIAVLLVIGRHLSHPDDAHWLLHVWQRGGWVGVDLFFVLSGFLVSGLLFREYQRHGELRIRRFLVRRGLKIYPAFYVFLAVTVAVKFARYQILPSAQSATGEVLFLQNYLGGVWGHTWSLAVEEHFYIGVALALGCVLRLRPGSSLTYLPHVVCFVAVSCLSMRLAMLGVEYDHTTHLFPSHLRADSLAFGVLLSYFWQFHHSATVNLLRPVRHLLLICGVLLIVPAFVWPVESTPTIYTVGLTAFYVGSGFILLCFLLSAFPCNRLTCGVGKIGGYSYSIYLWHVPVLFWILPAFESRFFDLSPALTVVFSIVASCWFGVVAAKVIEVPVLRLRDRLFPSRTGDVPPVKAADGVGLC